jgi:hypothetical protein
MTTPAHWSDQANCAGRNPNIFYPGQGDDVGVARAKLICRRCDVKDECLAAALARGEPFGIWGGLTRTERRELGAPTRRVCPGCLAVWWAANSHGSQQVYCSAECRKVRRAQVRAEYMRRQRGAELPLTKREASA